jgi:hypothetical protein
VTSTDIAALEACGLHLSTDYKQFSASKQETLGFSVYVPVSEDPKETK